MTTDTIPTALRRTVPSRLWYASGTQICTRCLYDSSIPSVTFDADGRCNYCRIHDQMDSEYPTGTAGQQRLKQLAEQIRQAGKRRPYDVLVGVSGGCDSSYLVYQAKQLGLRPLAVHFDNTWNSAVATQNIHNVLKALNVDLWTYVVDNEEYDDLYRSFLHSGITNIDAPTDIALAVTLYMAATKFKVSYIFDGHSFRTEGIAPLGWMYMDGKLIDSVQTQFGTRKLKTFPNMPLWKFLYWSICRRVKRIRPLYFLDYDKEAAKRMLTADLGWTWYGGHHLENRFTQFLHSYYLPARFKIDFRVQGFSALIRAGQMSRAEGLDLLSKPPEYDATLLEFLKKRLDIPDEKFAQIMQQPCRSYRDYKTYKPTFERLRPLFWALYRLDLVPKRFYVKYTSRKDI